MFKGFDSQLGCHIAVKQTEKLHRSGAAVAALCADFELLKTLDHPNVVKVLEYSMDEGTGVAQLFMEWMSNGSVQTLIERTQFRLHESIVRRCFTDALKGLEYLHSKNVVHRDIKPANMLVDGDGVVELSDLGSGVILDPGAPGKQTVIVGTSPYLAPESINTGAYSPGVTSGLSRAAWWRWRRGSYLG